MQGQTHMHLSKFEGSALSRGVLDIEIRNRGGHYWHVSLFRSTQWCQSCACKGRRRRGKIQVKTSVQTQKSWKFLWNIDAAHPWHTTREIEVPLPWLVCFGGNNLWFDCSFKLASLTVSPAIHIKAVSTLCLVNIWIYSTKFMYDSTTTLELSMDYVSSILQYQIRIMFSISSSISQTATFWINSAILLEYTSIKYQIFHCWARGIFQCCLSYPCTSRMAAHHDLGFVNWHAPPHSEPPMYHRKGIPLFYPYRSMFEFHQIQ
jgi:hypothetical protein